MKKIIAVFFIIMSILVILVVFSSKQSQEKMFTIGIVNLNPKLDVVIEGFMVGMTKYGYIEGENINYIYDGALTSTEEIDSALQSLVSRDIDLILTLTTPVAKKAKQSMGNSDIPVVFAPVFSPIKSGLIKSLSSPGGNLTGVKAGGGTAKSLEWLLTIAPTTKRVFVPSNSKNKAADLSLNALKKGAAKLGVELLISEINNEKELIKAFSAIPENVDAIWLLNSYFLVSRVSMFSEAAIKYRLPLASGTSQYKAGVLISYAPNHFRMGEQASRLAHRILQGAKPSDLPVEMANFFLCINLQTASAIGLEISDNILEQADDIIQQTRSLNN